jgi:hypothetical protein
MKEYSQMVGQTKQLKNIKLHLGCGNKHINDFINIDVRKIEEVDLVDDISKLTSFTINSVDLIYASHVLEHFGRNEYINVLKRWYDLLKVGGVLRIEVPDFEKIVSYYNETKNLRILRGLLYGGQTYEQNFHYCSWDFNTLKDDLVLVGFTKVQKYDWRNTEHSHIDDFSQCYLPHMDKQNGQLMSLNVEAIK